MDHATKQERLRTIRMAMQELQRRHELSPQAKERGLRSLRAAYVRALGHPKHAI